MFYYALANQFTVSQKDLQEASHRMLYAIKKIREASNLEAKGYENSGPMFPAEFAEEAILRSARILGIHLGAESAGKLDVSEY